MAARASVRPKNQPKPGTSQANQQSPAEEQIRQRAYDLYRQRDGQGGSEVDDWLQAEAEVKSSRRPTEHTVS
jgi:outer membrane protein TolC